MNGMTLLTISAPGCFGVQAKRAIECPCGPFNSIGQVGGRCRLVVELAQVRQLQLHGDVGKHVAVDEFHRHHDRCRVVAGGEETAERPDRDRGDDRRPARKAADHRGLRVRADPPPRLGSESRSATVQGRVAPAHVSEHRSPDRPAQSSNQDGSSSLAGDLRKDRLVGAVEDENKIVVEVSSSAKSDAVLGPGADRI